MRPESRAETAIRRALVYVGDACDSTNGGQGDSMSHKDAATVAALAAIASAFAQIAMAEAALEALALARGETR